MTISTEVRKAGPFIGNGSASAFPFAFKVFKAADLIVVRRQDNIGEETTLVLDSDYHVTLNSNQDTTPGGVVTLVAGALAPGFTLVVSSELPYLQTTDLTNQGGFYPKVITNALDRLTIFCQQLAEITGRTLKLPITAPTNISAEIPLPNPSELIAWNETGTGLTTVSPQSLVTSIAYGSATADLFAGDGATTTFPLSTNPASVNNLDVSIGGHSQRPVQGGVGDYSWNGGASITFAVPPPAPTVPGDKNVLVRYMQAIPVSDSEALHAQTREVLRRSYAEAGFNLVDGSFETGGTLTAVADVLLQESTGATYAWAGALPKVVAPGFDPVGVVGFELRTAVLLRNDLASAVGAALVEWRREGPLNLQKSLSDRFLSATVVDFATEYLTMAEIEQIRRPYPDHNVDFNNAEILDITSKLLQAVSDLGGNGPSMTNGNLHSPAFILQLPAGVMGLNLSTNERILITSGNIMIRGAGAFNTRIKSLGTCREMFRFAGAYCTGLDHLTLDGGLPKTITGSEAYGCDIPLVLDQVAHWYHEDLHICNYRHRGVQAIHLWESYMGSLRMYAGGWYSPDGTVPGGIFFDDYRKEVNFFPGSESNQVYIAKLAVSVVGRVIDWSGPSFNVVVGNLVSENFTLGYGYKPAGHDASKIKVSSSSCVGIMSAWHYYHDEPEAVGQAVLFDLFAAGPGCFFDHQWVFQSLTTEPGYRLHVPTMINIDATYPVEMNINIDDRLGARTTLFGGRRAPSQVFGTVQYYGPTSRTLEDFIGANGIGGFIGDISFKAGDWTESTPAYYHYKGTSTTVSPITGAGVYTESKKAIRAAASMHGGTGEVYSSDGFASSVRASTGTYGFTFKQSMPSIGYSVSAMIQKTASAGDTAEIASKSNSGFSLTVRDASGVLHDCGYLDVTVIM